MRRSTFVLCIIISVGCGVPHHATTDASAVDASVDTFVDMTPDAPEDMVTLSQTTDEVPDLSSGFGCYGGMSQSLDVEYARVFSLAEATITTNLHVQEVSFIVSGSYGSPEVTVRVGTYSGALGAPTFPRNDITEVSSTNFIVSPTTGIETVAVPISATIHPTDLLYVGVHVPDQTFTGKTLFMASTKSAETHSAYFVGNDCTGVNVASLASYGYPYHLMISVSGTH